ncbi:putative RNA polymerase associated transcriptional specificity factor [Alphaentomopoxvirus acuprea]|uniref:RNA polymerase-associated transcription-specificity factor RAP94 n=1 Tax=Alphaentomopoxvirus acuprea TaxID=62099 RepID=W6JL13_9POXV|nr:putative RNA polymerase associated transcriptional specificity factor [Anomala cuprea entomopoxvirus]BAO49510.1 putative RNA polymerase associated transcriptional specificity factor [Anomala cuprea entomopoxvirus]
MDNQYNIINLIDYMKQGINNKLTIDEFIIHNSELYTDYVSYNSIISESDFKFLYGIIEKDPTLNNNIIFNIFKLSQISFDQNVYISKLITNKPIVQINKDIDINNYMLLLNKLVLIQPLPKFINILWDTKTKINNIEDLGYINNSTSTILSTIEYSKINIIYISYSQLFSQFEKNKDLLSMQRKFKIYNNLTRIIGVPISSSNQVLDYFIIATINNNSLIYTISDSIATKKIKIFEYGTYSLKDIKSIIQDTINLVSTHIINNNKHLLYQRVFISPILNIYYSSIFPVITKYINIAPEYTYYYKLYEPEPLQYDITICAHVDNAKKLFKSVVNFYENTNKFLNEYILFKNKLAICKICGEVLDMLNFEEATYLQSRGEIIIISNIDNIFQYETYSKLINAEIFLSDIISIYDDIFKTNRISEFNNVSRLIIDFFIHINTNRLEYQDKYKDELGKSKLFFIRLTNNIFIASFHEKEQYKEERYLNMFIIIVICLILDSNFNELINIIRNNRNINTKLDSNNIKKSLNNFIYDIVMIFLINQKIITKDDTIINIKIIINTYLEILTNELQAYYNILLTRFYNNIDIIKFDIIDIVEIPLTPINIKYNYNNINNFISLNINSLENITNYKENIPINIKINYISIDDLNIKHYDDFDNDDINMELSMIINKFKLEIYYKNILINYMEQIDDNNFYIDTNQRYFFIISNLLYSNPFSYKSNSNFILYNFGDALPFITTINELHLSLLIDNLNIFLNYFFPSYYFVNDIKSNISRMYWYYFFYNLLVFVTNNNLSIWKITNNESIKNKHHNLLSYYSTVI